MDILLEKEKPIEGADATAILNAFARVSMASFQEMAAFQVENEGPRRDEILILAERGQHKVTDLACAIANVFDGIQQVGDWQSPRIVFGLYNGRDFGIAIHADAKSEAHRLVRNRLADNRFQVFCEAKGVKRIKINHCVLNTPLTLSSFN